MSRSLAAVHRRRDFASFSTSQRRGRSGPLRVTHVPADGVHEVAYGVGRSVGTAVVRNRVRRRLRVLMRELHDADRLPEGRYLVSAAPSAVAADLGTLRRHLGTALGALS